MQQLFRNNKYVWEKKKQKKLEVHFSLNIYNAQDDLHSLWHLIVGTTLWGRYYFYNKGNGISRKFNWLDKSHS